MRVRPQMETMRFILFKSDNYTMKVKVMKGRHRWKQSQDLDAAIISSTLFFLLCDYFVGCLGVKVTPTNHMLDNSSSDKWKRFHLTKCCHHSALISFLEMRNDHC